MNYNPLMPAFLEHPGEAAIIGRMLAGYGELEFLSCIRMSEPLGDMNKAARLLFRTRGEEQRINIADAILRPFYAEHGLEEIWVTARRAFSKCKEYRNQYSHCHWLSDIELGLFFTNLDTAAKTVEGRIALAFFHIDVPLLEQQESYFRYAGNRLIYLNSEYRLRAGKLRNHNYAVPPKRDPPPRHNPPEKHPIRPVSLGIG